jgi:hypothetical protein
MKMVQTECSETLAFKLQKPLNNSEESIRYSKHGESLKSRKSVYFPKAHGSIKRLSFYVEQDCVSFELEASKQVSKQANKQTNKHIRHLTA